MHDLFARPDWAIALGKVQCCRHGRIDSKIIRRRPVQHEGGHKANHFTFVAAKDKKPLWLAAQPILRNLCRSLPFVRSHHCDDCWGIFRGSQLSIGAIEGIPSEKGFHTWVVPADEEDVKPQTLLINSARLSKSRPQVQTRTLIE